MGLIIPTEKDATLFPFSGPGAKEQIIKISKIIRGKETETDKELTNILRELKK
jgi:hypothetical protein